MKAPLEKEFWKRKPLSLMTPEEWEALCDGCGVCCLEKLEDDDDGEVYYTNVACRLLNHKTCRCKHYEKRAAYVPECLPITLGTPRIFYWLPPTCAYKRLYYGQELPDWHWLVCGDKEEVHRQGYSVKNKSRPCDEKMDLDDYIIGSVSEGIDGRSLEKYKRRQS